MSSFVPAGQGTMAAIIALPKEKVQQCIDHIDGAEVANYNCPGQIVITGEKDAVHEGMEKLSEMGGVATRRGAFCAHPYVWRLMGIPDSALESFEGCADAKTPGMVRVSFGIYNTTEEVDKFLEILPKAMAAAKEEGEMIDVVPEY